MVKQNLAYEGLNLDQSSFEFRIRELLGVQKSKIAFNISVERFYYNKSHQSACKNVTPHDLLLSS